MKKGDKKQDLDKKSKTKYKTEKKVIYKTVTKKRFKLKMHTVLIALVCLYVLGYLAYYIINKPVSNIYISGNSYYSDWEIIKMAGLDDYPASLLNPGSKIENKLEKNILISSVKVTKKNFTEVYIAITENKPLFYNVLTSKTVFANGKESSNIYDAPNLVNELPAKIYKKFIKNMNNINSDVFRKISEIKYDPDEVDDGRILLTMIDGNYVYITMLKFNLLNDYNDIVKEFNNKKGILYLNSGGYFKIIEN